MVSLGLPPRPCSMCTVLCRPNTVEVCIPIPPVQDMVCHAFVIDEGAQLLGETPRINWKHQIGCPWMIPAPRPSWRPINAGANIIFHRFIRTHWTHDGPWLLPPLLPHLPLPAVACSPYIATTSSMSGTFFLRRRHWCSPQEIVGWIVSCGMVTFSLEAYIRVAAFTTFLPYIARKEEAQRNDGGSSVMYV